MNPDKFRIPTSVLNVLGNSDATDYRYTSAGGNVLIGKRTIVYFEKDPNFFFKKMLLYKT